MLILRGVNVFPSAVREVVNEFAAEVTRVLLIRPRAAGVPQEPPLTIVVEGAGADLAERIQTRIREKLMFAAEVTLAPPQSLPRSEYKSKLAPTP
ncbi:MAG: hypothetical protein ACLPN5_10840 [Roseiarcus sp.]